MQDLQHQFVCKESLWVWALLAAARHRCLQEQVAFQSSDLAVGGVGVFLDPQQLLPEQGSANGCGIEASIADQATALVGLEPCLVEQSWIAWGIQINAFHLPKPVKPVGVNQVVPIRGPWQRCRKAPVGPIVQPLFEASLSPDGTTTEQDGEADQQHPQPPFHV